MAPRLRRFVILFLAMLLVACSRKPTFVTPEYARTHLLESSLAIAPLANRPRVDVAKGATERLAVDLLDDLYLAFFREELPAAIKARSGFRQVVSASFSNQPVFRPRLLRLDNNERIRVDLPVTPVEFDSGQADFILFIEDLRVKVERGESPESDPMKGYNLSGNINLKAPDRARDHTFAIVQNAVYAIYDRRAGKVASYGKIRCKTVITQDMLEFVLITAMGDLASAILQGTPFQG